MIEFKGEGGSSVWISPEHVCTLTEQVRHVGRVTKVTCTGGHDPVYVVHDIKEVAKKITEGCKNEGN